MKKRALYSGMAGFAMVALLGASMGGRVAGQASGPTANVGKGEIGGTVTSTKGPEAGVWVIAETTDLPTRYMKEVVTDDRGRYLIPNLPQANYTVWARGYGLLDSAKVKTEPGKVVDLKPTVAPDAKSAAHYYPAIYWYSLVNVPKANEFPGTGPQGNGILPAVKSQAQWVEGMKTDGCEACHQVGNEYTRTIPSMFSNLDPPQAWLRRLQSGQAAGQMFGGTLSRLGLKRFSEMLADWTTRIQQVNCPPRRLRGPKALSGMS